MTTESIEPIFQESLFADPLGLRFRHQREKNRWSKESVAQQLKLPTSVIDAIEREDWARLGAPIYIRSYVGSYAKLLGLPVELADDIIRNKPTPELVYNSGNSGVRRMLDRSLRNVAYLVMTIVIVGSVVMLVMHFQSPAGIAQVLPLDSPVTVADVGHASNRNAQSVSVANELTAPAATAPANATQANAGLVTSETPVMASLAPSMPAVNAGSGDLVLKFRDQSWLEVLDGNGQRIERGLVAAGSERHFGLGRIAHITVGNADAVDASRDGRSIDLAPFREANVARFNFSMQVSVVPPGG